MYGWDMPKVQNEMTVNSFANINLTKHLIAGFNLTEKRKKNKR